MLKFLGQHIVDLIARFRSDVYLENVESGTIANGGNLGLDSNNKIVKAEAGPTYSDDQALGIGTGNDFTAVHNGTDTFLGNNTGDLYITQQADDKDIFIRGDDGSGGVTEYIRIDGGVKRTLFKEEGRFTDSVNLKFGTGGDTMIYHDGSNSYIDHTGTGNLNIRQGTDDGNISFQCDDGSGGITEYFRLDGSTTHSYFSAGNVGIGTTSPSKKLHVNGDVLIESTNPALFFTDTNSDSDYSIKVNGGVLNVRDETNDTARISLKSNGNVGIGTTSPQQLLDISAVAGATLRLTSTGDGLGGDATIAGIEFFGNDASVPGAGVKSSIVAKTEASLGDDSNLIFSTSDGTTNNVERVRINPSGNVGIGISNPSGKLMVIDVTASATTQKFHVGRGANAGLYITDDDATAYIKSIQDENATGYGNLTLMADDDGNKDGYISFNHSDTGEKMRITDTGNVGIGTSSPGEKLEVAGNISIGDSDQIKFGANNDLKIYHNSSLARNIIDNDVGDLYINQNAADKDILFRCDDGSGGTETYFMLDGSASSGNPVTIFPDNSKLAIGTSSHGISLVHDGSDSTITNAVGNLTITNFQDDGDIIFKSDDGSGSTTEYFRVDGGSEKTIYTKPISLLDSVGVQLGTGTDAQIYHTGSEGTFINYTGNFRFIQSADDADISFYSDDGSGGTAEYFRLDGSTEEIIVSKKMQFGDNVKAVFGTGEDLDIFHDGTDSTINNAVGHLIISNDGDDKDIVFKSDNGSGGLSEYFRVDGDLTKSVFSKNLMFLDSVKAQFGDSNDIEIYHNGTNSYIDNDTGHLYISNNADDSDILFQTDDGSGGTTTYFKVDGSDERTLFSKKVRIDHDVSDASVADVALDIDMDVSGSDALSSDITQKGINVNLNSTATGGDTSDEHRLIAIQAQSSVDGSSDADVVTGVYGLAKSNRSSSATSSLLRAVQGIAYVTDSAAATSTDIRGGDFSCYINTDGPDVTSMYGVISNAYTNTNSTDNVSNVHGLYGKAESRGSGTISNANGVYGEIEVDAGTITNGNCFRAVLDHNGGTLTTGYMFRGSVTGTVGTTYGVYVDGEDRNYFSNRVGIGASAPSNLLHVKAADGVMVDTYTALIQNEEATAGDNFGLSVQAGTNSSDVSFRVMDKDSSEFFRIRGDGKIGVGTTSPSDKVEIYANGADVALRIHEDAGTHEAKLHLRRGGADWELINTNDFTIECEGSEKLRIDTSGNVGIGTSSPGEKLEVDGNIKTSGNLTVATDIIHSGDTDTMIRFTTDNIRLQAGGNNTLELDGANATFAGNISLTGSVQKQIQVFPMNFTDDLGTDKHFMPFVTNTEQTVNYQEEACMVMPADGRVVSVTVHYAQMHGSDGNITVGIETSPCGQSYTNTWDIEETETIAASVADDHHVFHFAFDNAKHFESTDKMAISIQQSTAMQNASRFFWVTAVVEYDWSTFLGGTSAEHTTTP